MRFIKTLLATALLLAACTHAHAQLSTTGGGSSSGGSGTVNSGTSGQVAAYSATGTAVGGVSTITCANLPAAASGDATRSAGSCASTVVGINGTNLATTFAGGAAIAKISTSGVPAPAVANADYIAPVAESISGLSYSPSDTSIVASWYTVSASDSHLSCGGKLAVDDGVEINQTFHQAIVAGLTANTAYSCFVTSGGTASSTTSVTTNVAATRTAITGIMLGTAGSPANIATGDTLYNCVSNDAKTYAMEDDGGGFVLGSANSGANMQIGTFTNMATLTGGALVNLLSSYGGSVTTNGSDGPGNVAMSNKLSGLWCMGGNLYAFQTRAKYGTGTVAQLQWYGNIMKSADHGATWNSWQNPSGAYANGIPPNPLGSYMFNGGGASVNTTATLNSTNVIVVASATGIVVGQTIYGSGIPLSTFVQSISGTSITMTQSATASASGVAVNFGSTIGWVSPVRYALDDGTLGYLTAGNRIDGAGAYVYMTYTDGFWDNSSNLYLMRMSRRSFTQQNPGTVQYFTQTSPTPANFVLDSNWSTSASAAVPIYSAASQTSSPSLDYLPAYNEYLLLTWYYPAVGTTSNSTWVISAGPTPAGPFTQIATQAYSPQGYYNPVPTHSSVAANTSIADTPLTFITAGSGAYYKPYYMPVLLNPLPLIDATAPATYAGSVAHQLKASYSGPLINVQRSSDSTNMDIPQTGAGLLNQTTLTTFCTGTTCGVRILYDQSGNGNNISQSTFANMPVIYTAGAVTVNGVNSQPAAYWNSTQQYLSAVIPLSGSSFESVGVAQINSGAPSYAGLVTLTDGTCGGGSGPGCVDLLGRSASTSAVAAAAGGVCGLAISTFPSYTAQFEWNSYTTETSGQTCGSSINGGAFVTTTASASHALTATTLLVGAGEPTSTYYLVGYMSDVVVYPSYLTTLQRAAAHAEETFTFGTP